MLKNLRGQESRVEKLVDLPWSGGTAPLNIRTSVGLTLNCPESCFADGAYQSPAFCLYDLDPQIWVETLGWIIVHDAVLQERLDEFWSDACLFESAPALFGLA